MTHAVHSERGSTREPRLVQLAGLGAVALVLGALYLLRSRLPVMAWYGLLSQPASLLTDPIGQAADTLNIPLLSALLFGLIGAISPCQLSTNLAAFAYATRRLDRPESIVASGAAYLAGKIVVYTVAGLGAVALGVGLQQASIPVIVAARKALGPVLLVMGLVMLGVIGLRFSAGSEVATWFRRRAAGRGVFGSFLLGVAFAFVFCPTLFLLFFGLTLPLAMTSAVGVVFPAVFALGTTLPLMVFIGLAAVGGVSAGSFLGRAEGFSRWLNRAVGVVFLLVGLNEIVLYWLS